MLCTKQVPFSPGDVPHVDLCWDHMSQFPLLLGLDFCRGWNMCHSHCGLGTV